jgi:hypothetical protein
MLPNPQTTHLLPASTPITHEALLTMDFSQKPNGLYFTFLDALGYVNFFVDAPDGCAAVTAYASYTEGQEEDAGCILKGLATNVGELEALYQKAQARAVETDSIGGEATAHPEGTTPW